MEQYEIEQRLRDIARVMLGHGAVVSDIPDIKTTLDSLAQKVGVKADTAAVYDLRQDLIKLQKEVADLKANVPKIVVDAIKKEGGKL